MISFFKSKKYKIIGVMSGTSLDGLDIAYCEFVFKNGKWKFEIPYAETISYDMHWKNVLQHAHEEKIENFLLLDRHFGEFIGKKVNQFCKKNSLHPDFISSHGHTIFHQPEKKLTHQIGHGAHIYAISGIPTISDFRTVDVALGGQGAPLVPIGDQLLFNEYDACLNVGGIANISYTTNNKRIAFDICPANFVLNYLANQIELEYDKNGEIAKTGILNQKMFDELNQLNYYQIPSPKSLGREWIHRFIFPIIDSYTLPISDKLNTYIHHIAYQLSNVLNELSEKNNQYTVLITGGGAFHTFLWKEIIPIYLNKKNQLVFPDSITINFKEALIFAFLGVLRIRKEENSLHTITGASQDSCGGIVFGNKKFK